MKTIATLLDERLVVLDADVETAEDCIRLMAGLFEKYGYVKHQPGHTPHQQRPGEQTRGGRDYSPEAGGVRHDGAEGHQAVLRGDYALGGTGFQAPGRHAEEDDEDHPGRGPAPAAEGFQG